MHLSAGPSEHSWQPMKTADTTSSHYWLNWRVYLCAIWIMISMIIAAFLIYKYEGKSKSVEGELKIKEDSPGTLYEYELWMPCLEVIHPVCLLGFRVLSFFLLLALLVTNVVIDGASIFYYYTQWTFMLLILYFGLGSSLSIYGCHQYYRKKGSINIIEDARKLDEENTAHVTAIKETKGMNRKCQNKTELAGFYGYLLQIIYQTNAGAVMLTDCVFWFIIFPFLALKDYELNFILIGIHTVNAIFLLGDTALNSMRFQWFRVSYFLLWTSAFVIFQWLLHAFVSIWWPYPFLDLATPQAPMWYLIVAVMHIPCYAIFSLIVKIKHHVLSRYFSESYLYTN